MCGSASIVANCSHCGGSLIFADTGVPVRMIGICQYCRRQLLVTVTPAGRECIPGQGHYETVAQHDVAYSGWAYLVPCPGAVVYDTVYVEDYVERPATITLTPLALDLAGWSLPNRPPQTPLIASTTDITEHDLSRNLLLPGGPIGSRFREEVRSRIANLKGLAPQIDRALQTQGLTGIVSVYLLGSALWESNPNDIDLVALVASERPLEVLPPLRTFEPPLHVRVLGQPNLVRAVEEGTGEEVRLHYECLTLYATAVLLAGCDLFADCSVPRRNLEAWVEYLRLDLSGVCDLVPGVSAVSSDKRRRWWRDLARLETRIAQLPSES